MEKKTKTEKTVNIKHFSCFAGLWEDSQTSFEPILEQERRKERREEERRGEEREEREVNS